MEHSNIIKQLLIEQLASLTALVEDDLTEFYPSIDRIYLDAYIFYDHDLVEKYFRENNLNENDHDDLLSEMRDIQNDNLHILCDIIDDNPFYYELNEEGREHYITELDSIIESFENHCFFAWVDDINESFNHQQDDIRIDSRNTKSGRTQYLSLDDKYFDKKFSSTSKLFGDKK